jgi:sugar/nucleoside kinase (ribokinase family)
MYDHIKNHIKEQLTQIKKDNSKNYMHLKEAWQSSRLNGTSSAIDSQKRMIPFIGSGLNNLTKGGIGSWDSLVKEIRNSVEFEEPFNVVQKSGLKLPQELDVFLDEGQRNPKYRGKILTLFNEMFSKSIIPTNFHLRIYNLFPTLITLNYRNIYSSLKNSRNAIDLTDPTVAYDKISYNHEAIYHLHGLYKKNDSSETHKNQIFWGIMGDHAQPHKCLVLTEKQYHRLYLNDNEFQRKVEGVFHQDNYMLFLGVGLSPNEFGIHHILREHDMAQRTTPVGLLLSFGMDDIKRILLNKLGISTLVLPDGFGYSRQNRELLFHAFVDVCESLFIPDDERIFASPVPHHQRPEIICAGLSQLFQIAAIKGFIERETSYSYLNTGFHREVGGQHLSPALYLLEKGHRVALASRIGNDSLGDEIIQTIKNSVDEFEKKEPNKRDFFTLLIHRAGYTRESFIITYQNTRTIYDNDGPDAPPIFNLDNDDITKFKGIRAIYLGWHHPKMQMQIIDALGNVPLRFFETGTCGPKSSDEFQEALYIARKCNFIIASSEWIVRIGALNDACTYDPEKKRVDYQKRLYDDFVNGRNGTIAQAAYEYLWPDKKVKKTLIITMGKYGSSFVRRTNKKPKFKLIKPHIIQQEDAISWAGCGNIYRAEFIHQVLIGEEDLEKACQSASKVAGEKTRTLSFK